MSRKDFFRQFFGLLSVTMGVSATESCNPHNIGGSMVGAASEKGHLLRGHQFPVASSKRSVQTVIVGGGISGLSAARMLLKNGYTHFELLELHDEVGGNAIGGINPVSAYPWGAHYLPVPNHADTLLIEFLKETGVVTGFAENGLPIYNEEYLCFEPEERLFINGYWQEGLIPDFGVPEHDKMEIQRFLSLMSTYSRAKGIDGKDAFCIPLSQASTDPAFLQWDQITFQQFLEKQHFTSPYLHWYVNYCLKDDYGTTADQVSAWSGIHYFASRKGSAANTETDTVLTWPEGNAWLVKKLREMVKAHIVTNALVFKVKKTQSHKYLVTYYSNGLAHEIEAEKVIMATPQFVNKKVVEGYEQKNMSMFTYAPWMVANITVDAFSESVKGLAMSWDNVPYGRASLGYIDATHQLIRQFSASKVLTFYLPLCEGTPAEERHNAYQLSHKDWKEKVLAELEYMHPGIKGSITNIDVWLWGHGMIRPVPGFQHYRIANQSRLSGRDNLFFAHSDLSGISIFEEAFHQGIIAAQNVLERANNA